MLVPIVVLPLTLIVYRPGESFVLVPITRSATPMPLIDWEGDH